MVKLNRIYTRTGDDGSTGLADGSRVSKDHLRVECYGTVDEANAFVAAAHVACLGAVAGGQSAAALGGERLGQIAAVLARIQNELFDAGADLATPVKPGEKPGSRLRLTPEQTERLERDIDDFNERMAALTSFVLPGGSAASAALHVARAVVRRAERLAVQLVASNPQECSAEAVKYLNRLSDLLFVLARAANRDGALDVLWVPGATRAG